MAALTKDELNFLLRRLHSLSGIIPIGGFLLFHFFENASARHGAEAFNQAVLKISEMPYIYVMEVLVLAVPILFHGIYGLFISGTSRPNVANYPYERNIAYFLQRASGVIAFAYIIFHVSTTRIWSLFVKGDHITFADMSLQLSNPVVLIFYVLGILSITYHFSNGIWSFSVTWGLVTSGDAQRRLSRACMGMFFVLALVGLDIVFSFRIGHSFMASLWSTVL
jgi:succinate dehydrogenase / fumarate reductase cytochrome b subunit